jgi:predicted short-subunit dehydrogenase-like oxidoreductase (DUF2520 family)
MNLREYLKLMKKNRIDGIIGIIGIIGMGRVGSVLALQGECLGLQIGVVLDTDDTAVKRIRRLMQTSPSTDEKELSRCSAVFISVPDRAIDNVTEQLLARKLIRPGTLLAHTSGIHTWNAAALEEEHGLVAGSIHPLMAFPRDPLDARSLEGVGFALDGVEEARDELRVLVQRFRGIPLEIPVENKSLYHAAAVFASNFPVLMHGIALDILQSTGLDRQTARTVLNTLLDSVRQNLAALDPQNALSGPAVRNDRQTIETHIRNLQNRYPQYAGLYRILTDAIFEFLKQIR